MRLLFLSNTRGNNNPEVRAQMVGWFGEESKIAFIPSVSDTNRKHFTEVSNWFRVINENIRAEYLEIHDGTLWDIDRLKNFDGVYLSGGNAYSLLQGLKNSKMSLAIKEYALGSGKPIIEVSAGGIALTPRISIARAPNTVGLADESGLSVVNFGFCPHYENNQTSLDRIHGYLREEPVQELFAVTEFAGLAVEDNNYIALGEVCRFTPVKGSPEKLN